ncbi:MAG: hypothetical protein ACRBDI_09800 [Alphaproteobacteria bacterium]
MRGYLVQILLQMGIPRDIVFSFDPFLVMFVVVFSTEIIVMYIFFLFWFMKRGNVKKYHDGYSGFPDDMVRRVDTSDKTHKYDMGRRGRLYNEGKRKSAFGVVFFLAFTLTALVFLAMYAYSWII